MIVSADWFSASDEAGSSLRVRYLTSVLTLLTVAHVHWTESGHVVLARVPCSKSYKHSNHLSNLHHSLLTYGAIRNTLDSENLQEHQPYFKVKQPI